MCDLERPLTELDCHAATEASLYIERLTSSTARPAGGLQTKLIVPSYSLTHVLLPQGYIRNESGGFFTS